MPELLHIVYAPASYYRPWRATYGAASAAQQRWLNATLIRQHALPMPPAGVSANATLARRMVGLWERLPEVATLIGAARLRDWVEVQRTAAALPLPVQAFMRAGHVPRELPERPTTRLEDDPDLLLRWGGRDVQAMAPMLPTWLAARLWLPLRAAEGESPQREIRPDMDLFWSAVNYVEKLS